MSEKMSETKIDYEVHPNEGVETFAIPGEHVTEDRVREAELVPKEAKQSQEALEQQITELQAVKIGTSGLKSFLKRERNEAEANLRIQATKAKFGARLASLSNLSGKELNKKEMVGM